MALSKKTLIALTALAITGGTPAISFAETVTEKLNAKKEAFLESANEEKITDYEQGIKDVAASGVLDKALNVGDKAPDFTLPSAIESKITLSELLKDGPVVMTWYRGEWCPYCNIYLEDLQKHADDFTEAGAQIVAISPEKIDNGMKLADRMALKYHVLSDEGSKVAKDYGVVYTVPPKIAEYYQNAFDLNGANNDDRNLLPLSASYVINQDGIITYAYLNADYRERAETELLLEEVKKLKSDM